jgi:hypothetical protein
MGDVLAFMAYQHAISNQSNQNPFPQAAPLLSILLLQEMKPIIRKHISERL